MGLWESAVISKTVHPIWMNIKADSLHCIIMCSCPNTVGTHRISIQYGGLGGKMTGSTRLVITSWVGVNQGKTAPNHGSLTPSFCRPVILSHTNKVKNNTRYSTISLGRMGEGTEKRKIPRICILAH